MTLTFKIDQNWNITKMGISLNWKCHKIGFSLNFNVIKIGMSLKLVRASCLESFQQNLVVQLNWVKSNNMDKY